MNIAPNMTDDAVLAELGQRLERVRLERNLSQEQVATEAGVSRQTLGRIEAGGPSKLPALVRVLRALDLLEGLDLVVPEPVPSPIQALERHGRRRQRARPRPAVPPGEDGWTWGTP